MSRSIEVIFSTSKVYSKTAIERGVVVGFSGKQGEPGDAGGAGSKVTYTSGTGLSSGRVVSAINNIANYHDPEGNYEPVGVTENAVIGGDNVDVVLSGALTISGWGLTPGSVYYAASNGALTADPSQCLGRVQQIGYAEDANTLVINIQAGIYL